MPISNYPKGFAEGVNIRGIPLLNLYPGSIWWVDSVNGSNGNKGTFDRPFASFDYATGRAAAGDIVIAKPGHVETIGSAGALTCDTAGVCYVFLGQGSNKAYLNFTATAGTVLITAANVTFVNPRLVAGIDAVVNAIVVQAADFAMYNVEDYDAAAKAITIGVLTTSAAQRLCIDGYRYHASTTGTQKTERIKTVGALDHIQLYNLDIAGDFSNSAVNMANAACTNVDLKNLNLNNTNTGPQPGLKLHANTTGWAEDVKIRVASGSTYYDSAAKLQWGPDCVGYNTDGSGGSALGTSTDISAKVDSVGVQASTVDSRAASVGIQTSTVNSKTDSVGIQASTIQSKTDSVGITASTGNSLAASVGVVAGTTSTGVSTVQSKVDSVGLTASANTSIGASIAVGTSTVLSTAQSVGVAAVSVGTNLSTVKSIALANAASILSVGTQVSTVNSVGAANAASINSVGAQTSTVNSKADSVGIQVSTCTSAAQSVGIQTSTVNSKSDSVGLGVSTHISQGTSIGVATSTMISMLLSIATVISTINSKT